MHFFLRCCLRESRKKNPSALNLGSGRRLSDYPLGCSTTELYESCRVTSLPVPRLRKVSLLGTLNSIVARSLSLLL